MKCGISAGAFRPRGEKVRDANRQGDWPITAGEVGHWIAARHRRCHAPAHISDHTRRSPPAVRPTPRGSFRRRWHCSSARPNCRSGAPPSRGRSCKHLARGRSLNRRADCRPVRRPAAFDGRRNQRKKVPAETAGRISGRRASVLQFVPEVASAILSLRLSDRALSVTPAALRLRFATGISTRQAQWSTLPARSLVPTPLHRPGFAGPPLPLCVITA